MRDLFIATYENTFSGKKAHKSVNKIHFTQPATTQKQAHGIFKGAYYAKN